MHPTLFSFHEMSGKSLDDNLEMFYKHWSVQNETLAVLNILCKKRKEKKKIQQCVCVCVLIYIVVC